MVGSIAALMLTSLAIMGSPGPATLSLVAAGSTYGARRCAAYALGIIGGTAFVLIAVATGVTGVLLAVPSLRSVLVGVSVLYILWLAYHIATAPPLAVSTAPPPSARGGALLGVANPKAWTAIAAVFAGSQLGSAVKLAVLTAMIVVINTSWLVAGTSLAPLLRDPRRARIVNVTLALALVGASALAVVR